MAMVIHAFLIVSSDRQDLHNQRHSILEYVNTHALSPIRFIGLTVPHRVNLTLKLKVRWSKLVSNCFFLKDWCENYADRANFYLV